MLAALRVMELGRLASSAILESKCSYLSVSTQPLDNYLSLKSYHIIDAWRCIHPSDKQYTFFSAPHKCADAESRSDTSAMH